MHEGDEMKVSEIEVGKTYSNRGKGTTMRTVLAISDEHIPTIFFGSKRPIGEQGVLYKQFGSSGACSISNLYLSSFAAWAGKEVT